MSSQIKNLKEEYRKKKKENSSAASNVESLFFHQLKESSLHPKIISQARKNGALNLSGRGMVELPDIVWNLSCLTQDELKSLSHCMDTAVDGQWWEYVDLTKLIVASNALKAISPDIRNHQALTVLDLHDNCLVTLPAELAELHNLKKLDISRNNFELFPSCIYALKMLQNLNAHHNNLEALDDEIGNLSFLEELNVSHNNFQVLPHSIGFLSRVNLLDASNNKVISLPPELGDICALRRLDLSSNQLQELPAEVENLRHLEQLYLSHNKLRSLPSLPKGNILKEVHCGFNCIEELSSEFFTFLSGIKILDFRDNKITELPEDIYVAQSLEVLQLTNNSLSGLPYTLGTMPHLKILSLEGNPLKSIRRDIVQRGTVHLLKWLCSRIKEPVDFKRNHEISTLDAIGSSGIIDKSTLRSSKTLNCSNKGLTTVPDVIIADSIEADVTAIDLSKNSLTAVSDAVQPLLPKVSELNLSFNKLEFLPRFFSISKNLQYLDIRNNKIETLPSELSTLEKLREINLSFNKFKELPKVLYQLKKLEIILASDNKMDQMDVAGLSMLPLLTVLDLHNNDIRMVPPELGNLTNLRSLQLEGNLFRNPRAAVLANGTDSVLKYLRNQIHQNQT